MPPNYQNSLGWLDLNLRAQREKDLQEQAFKREQMAREDRQVEAQNSLGIGKIAAQALGDSENRKLQLADLMARVKLQEEGKDRRQDDKQNWEQPKIDAAVQKAMAEAEYKKAQTAEVPLESGRRDANVASQVAERGTRHDDRRYNADMGFAGKLMARDPNTGQQMSTMAPGGKVAGIAESLGLVPNLAPPGEVFVSKDERKAAGKDFGEAYQELQDSEDAIKQVRGAKKEFFNPVAGGTDVTFPKVLPFVGGKKTHIGGNAWKDLEANAGSLTPEQKADVNQRRATGQAIRKLTQSYRKKMTGAAFSDQESKDYLATIVGMDVEDPFSIDQDLLASALERTRDHIKTRTALLEHIKNTGRAPSNMTTMTNAELEQYLAGGGSEAAQQGIRREPSAELAPGPAGTQETPEAARKRRIELGRRDPAIKAKLKAARDALPPDMPPEQKAEELHKILEQLVP